MPRIRLVRQRTGQHPSLRAPADRRLEFLDVAPDTVRVAVEGEGPPLLLLGGLGANLDMWAPVAPYLRGFELITFDPPGTGGSGPVRYGLGMPGLADLTARILHSLGRDRVDVLGYSWGGALAQELAHRHAALVRRLVLCATTCGLGGMPGTPKALAALATPWRYASAGQLERAAPTLYGGRARQDPRHSLRAHSQIPQGHGPRLLGYTVQLCAIARWTSLPWLHQLEQPTLIVAGDDDPVVPLGNARLLASRIPDSRLHVVPAGGHLLLIDQPEDAAPAVRSFLLDPAAPNGVDASGPRRPTRLRKRLLANG